MNGVERYAHCVDTRGNQRLHPESPCRVCQQMYEGQGPNLFVSLTDYEALRKRCEAVEADAGKWRLCNATYDLGDGERIECHVIVGVNSWKGKRWNGFHQPSADEFFETLASIDQAIAAAQEPSHG